MADTAVETPVVAEENEITEPEEVKTPAKKGSKGKTAKTPKTKATPKAKVASASKKQKKTVSENHPKYSQMISESIAALKERHGSSRQAILKYIMANFNVLQDEKLVNNHIKMSIRAGIKSGKLKQIKGSGACGSYKLGDTDKQSKPKTEKSTPTKKTNLTKVKKPKAASKKSNPQAKKTAGGKASPKSSPQKTKASPKKTPKKAKSPKKTKAKKVTESPKKSKKAAASEEKQGSEDVPATDAPVNE